MTIFEKLMRIQTEMKAPKNLFNKFGGYKYRNAEGIYEAVKPYLKEQRCTLTISDTIEVVGDRIYVKASATLVDVDGSGSITATALAREQSDKKGMDAAQITGATSSYARKYALNGLFLLDDTKDPDTDEYKVESDAKAKTDKENASEVKGEEIRDKNSLVNDREIAMMRACIDGVGVTEEQILRLYKRQSLSEFTIQLYNNLMENRDKLKSAVK